LNKLFTCLPALLAWSANACGGPTVETAIDARPLIPQTADVEDASYQPCSIGTADFPIPKAQPAVDMLVGKYLGECADRLFPALDSIYVGEERDESWARPLEEKIRQVTAPITGLTIAGDCRRSLCRFDFMYANPEIRGRLVVEFNRPLIDSVKDTPLSVGIVYSASLTGYMVYVYNDANPATFVEQLMNLMSSREVRQ
jgi:hypothetical protein